VLFVQRWDARLCPKREDYPIFFATMRKPGKDSSGDKIYVEDEFVEYREVTYESTPCINAFAGIKTTKYSKAAFNKKYGSVDKATKYWHKGMMSLCDGEQYKEMSKEDQARCEKKAFCAEYSEYRLDSHGHLIVDHDLYNHDGLTQDGIAEAFIEFAKRENLSFFA
jgi:type I restriction enzyme M protein